VKNKFVLFLFLLGLGVSCSPKTSIPEIITQSNWGSKPIPDTLSYAIHSINKITIHHGGVAYPESKNAIEYLSNLQAWSRREKQWPDIPYHYLITPDGIIYEGRADSLAGDTNTSYNPSGHLLICALGNFDEVEISEIQYKRLIELTAYLAQKHRIDFESIKTHKDYAETDCPGKNLYPFFVDGSFINQVKSIHF
jgi:hypothetical protein